MATTSREMELPGRSRQHTDSYYSRVTRGFNPAECDKYQIDHCPGLEEIRAGT